MPMSNEETSAELRKLTVRGLNPETLATLKVLAARAGQPLEAFVRETLEAIAVQPVAMQHYVLRAWSTSPALVGVVIRRAEEGAYPGATPGLSQEQKAAYDAAVECIERNDPGDREKAIGLLAQQFEDCYEQPLAKEQRYSIKFGNANRRGGGVIDRVPTPSGRDYGITAVFNAEGEALTAVEKAELLIRRNAPGDVEEAMQLLKGHFDHVREASQDSGVTS